MGAFLARLCLRSCALVAGLVFGCVTAGGVPAVPHYTYFEAPAAHDAWSPKIGEWQARAARRAAPSGEAAPAQVSGAGDDPREARDGALLRAKYEAFRSQRRREIAHEVAEWIQREARAHYLPDGPVDHWATFDETLARGAEDCDGLELLANGLLLELGFPEEEVYRAIVFRPADGQHHMVTFWFENRNDPWVIDPTGAMTTGMPRMSELPEWVPLKVFGARAEFTVRRARVGP